MRCDLVTWRKCSACPSPRDKTVTDARNEYDVLFTGIRGDDDSYGLNTERQMCAGVPDILDAEDILCTRLLEDFSATQVCQLILDMGPEKSLRRWAQTLP